MDELSGVGVPIRHEEYVDAILEGFHFDYAYVVSVIESKKHTPSIVEIETLLFGHEIRLKILVQPSLNYTQNLFSRGGFRGSSHGGGGPSKGRGDKFANFWC